MRGQVSPSVRVIRNCVYQVRAQCQIAVTAIMIRKETKRRGLKYAMTYQSRISCPINWSDLFSVNQGARQITQCLRNGHCPVRISLVRRRFPISHHQYHVLIYYHIIRRRDSNYIQGISFIRPNSLFSRICAVYFDVRLSWDAFSLRSLSRITDVNFRTTRISHVRRSFFFRR